MRMVMTVVLAGALCAAAVSPASAAGVTSFLGTDKLWEICDRSAVGSAPIACTTYILGVLDTMLTDPTLAARICFPTDMTAGAASLAVRRYIQAHPEAMDTAAASAVKAALLETYVCR